MRNSELAAEEHLLIVWEKARHREGEILETVKEQFQLLYELEIEWSKDKFSENLSRFYGANLPSGSDKEEHCGTGPFLLLVVRDKKPVYKQHETSKGPQTVNSKVFLMKSQLRELTGGGHKVHATNSREEFNHDIALLLGDDIDTYKNNKVRRRIKRDLAGAYGWKDLSQFFRIINMATHYVVLRNFEVLPNEFYTESHGDIDILTDDYVKFQYVANAKPVFNESFRVHNVVKVGDQEVLFDFRYQGDSYYDTLWEKHILDHRVGREGLIYVMDSENYFYSLLYHALIHKDKIASDYVDKLRKLNELHHFTKRTIEVLWFDSNAQKTLGRFLAKNHYSITRPEPSVRYNVSNEQKVRRAMWKTRPIKYVKKRVGRLIKSVKESSN